MFGKELTYTIAASVFASIGLVNNNLTQLIGAMLISPLGEPFLRIVNGEDIIANIALFVVLIMTCIMIGTMYMFAVSKLNPKFKESEFYTDPSSYMNKYAKWKGYAYINDIIYASLAGICLYIASQNIDTNTLVGVGIGITVLPPFIVIGMLISMYILEDVDNIYDKIISCSTEGTIYLSFLTMGYAGAKLFQTVAPLSF